MKLLRSTFALSLAAATIALAAENSVPTANASAFTSALTTSFPRWDRDHDGTLSGLEIDAAIALPEITGNDAAALAVVKRLARGKTWSSIPRTLENLTTLATQPRNREEPNLPAMFADGRSRLTRTARELFTEGTPRLTALCQGEMGNCFSLAPLGAMLSRDPAQVKSMFQENADGTYEVKIGARFVHIAAPTDAEIALSSSSESTGVWSNVYEKAAGVARNELRPEKERAGTPLDAIARGGSAGTMLAFITGHEMERFTLKWARDAKTTPEESAAKLDELRGKLHAAFAERRCVTTGTLRPTMSGLRGGHAYGVIGYEAASDEIHVWDPHGDTFTPQGLPSRKTGFPRAKGICALPLAVFAEQFAGLAFELPANAAGGVPSAATEERDTSVP